MAVVENNRGKNNMNYSAGDGVSTVFGKLGNDVVWDVFIEGKTLISSNKTIK